jgi:hypothetical protein
VIEEKDPVYIVYKLTTFIQQLIYAVEEEAGFKKGKSFNYRKGQGRGKYLFHALLMNTCRLYCTVYTYEETKKRRARQRSSLIILPGEPAFVDAESQRTKASVLARIGFA